jgi:hypothetical protein
MESGRSPCDCGALEVRICQPLVPFHESRRSNRSMEGREAEKRRRRPGPLMVIIIMAGEKTLLAPGFGK